MHPNNKVEKDKVDKKKKYKMPPNLIFNFFAPQLPRHALKFYLILQNPFKYIVDKT